MCQHAIAVIISFHGQQCAVINFRQFSDSVRQLSWRKVSVQFRALHPSAAFDDLSARIIAFGPSACGINSNDVLLTGLRGKPGNKPVIVAHFKSVTTRTLSLLYYL